MFSAFIKDVDRRPDPSVWGARLPFNTLCAEFRAPSGGWVHSVAFSPSGDALAFASHDSSISIAYPQGPDAPPVPLLTVRTPLLPFLSLLWISESEIVAAGHDCQPITFHGSEQGWYFPLPRKRYSSCLELSGLGNWERVWTTRLRVQVETVKRLRSTCSRIWTGRGVPRLVRILLYLLFIRIQLRCYGSLRGMVEV